MSNEEPTIANDELLARFILFSKWVRSDQTMKADAFIPHPYPDLSVTRHRGFTEEIIWQIGQTVADRRPATLYGRADLLATDVRKQSLAIVPRPVPDNLNHACVLGWPEDKPTQKIKAMELAMAARFLKRPAAKS